MHLKHCTQKHRTQTAATHITYPARLGYRVAAWQRCFRQHDGASAFGLLATDAGSPSAALQTEWWDLASIRAPIVCRTPLLFQPRKL